MGEAEDWKKDFSPEELTALGEAPEVKPDEKPLDDKKPDGDGAAPDKPGDEKGVKPESSTETEQTKEDDAPTQEETTAAEAMGLRIENGMIVDEDGTKIPPKRWKKLYFEHQERGRKLELTEKKHNLLKRVGPDEYYRIYPDEAPAGYAPKATAPTTEQALPIDDPRILTMKVTGGTYDGMTLEEVFDVDKPAAVKMYGQYVSSVNERTAKAREKEEKAQHEVQEAVVNFGRNRAKDLFGIDDPQRLTADQITAINRIGQDVLNWQVMHSKLHLDWEDAYKLMTYEQRISKAKEEAAASALKGLVKTPVPSIGNGSNSGKETGFEAMLSWTSDQMGKHIDGLSDNDFQKFVKDAPASLRTKFPGVFE